MDEKQATVKTHVSSQSTAAERIARDFADAWGEVGVRWGVPPATARVHGYLLARRRPLSEREVREALGISHRAASLALTESEAWGLVERVPEPRRVGRRGPPGAAWVAVGSHWRWFGRVVEQRRLREGDPAVAAIAAAAEAAARATSAAAAESASSAAGAAAESASSAAGAAAEAAARGADGGSFPAGGSPSSAAHADPELAELRDWLAAFLAFVRLFDRSAALVARVPPDELERAMRLLGHVPDELALRLVGLLAAVPDADLLALLGALGRLSPERASRAAKAIARVLRRFGA